jgi:hypothetical protein
VVGGRVVGAWAGLFEGGAVFCVGGVFEGGEGYGVCPGGTEYVRGVGVVQE